MKKCDCKIRNTLGKYQKIWPWIGVAGYAVDGAEAVLKHTKWGKAHYKLRMLIHGAGAGLLCLGAGVHGAGVCNGQGGCARRRQRVGHRLGHPRPELHARRGQENRPEAGARHAPRVLRRDGSRHGDARVRRPAAEAVKRVNMPISREPIGSRLIFGYLFSGRVSGCGQYSRRSLISQPNTQQTFARKSRSTICTRSA